jgi:hypothetical protein
MDSRFAVLQFSLVWSAEPWGLEKLRSATGGHQSFLPSDVEHPHFTHGCTSYGAVATSGNRRNSFTIMVPGGGVEPPRPEGRRILSPLRIAGYM